MEIEIQTSEELVLLLDALANEIVDASINNRLFRDIIGSMSTYQRVFNESNTFWSLTLEALRESSLTHLCRVYDQESRSLNLVNLLETIKANIHFFSEPNFRDRLAGNAFVDSLAKSRRIPDIVEIDKDTLSVTCENPTVKKLMIWRNNIVAHRGAKVSLGKNQILTNNPLSTEEFEDLLSHALAIFNKYSSLLRASTHSSQVIGRDDYKSLLKFAELGLQKWDEGIKRQMEAFKVKPPTS